MNKMIEINANSVSIIYAISLLISFQTVMVYQGQDANAIKLLGALVSAFFTNTVYFLVGLNVYYFFFN